MDGDGLVLLVVVVVFLLFSLYMCLCGVYGRERPPETPAQRVARVLAQWEELAVMAEVVLAEQWAAAPPVPMAAAPVLMALPYFPYAARGNGAPETLECSICLEQFREGELCSEVPKCRHVFYRECLGAWARSSGSCPLCRAKIMPGLDGAAAADDMV